MLVFNFKGLTNADDSCGPGMQKSFVYIMHCLIYITLILFYLTLRLVTEFRLSSFALFMTSLNIVLKAASC